ncbi:MAG: ABC transporter ATP-binding protein [Pseudomonadota bacterium]
MIVIDSLEVVFDAGGALEKIALKGVKLTINEGEFVTVIGGNGAGKSTLLNALSGEAAVSSGRVLIDGENVTSWSVDRRAGLVSRIFQDPMAGVCETLSIAENLALASARGRVRGLSLALNDRLRTEFKDRIAPLGLGLEDRLDDRIGLLSGGQRQAVCLVMATLRPAKILLLDEHTAALDPRAAAFVIEQTKEIVAQTGMTTLMVTHSMAQALDCGSRTIMMDQGRVALDVAGAQRAGLTPSGLVALFNQSHADRLDDDSLLNA